MDLGSTSYLETRDQVLDFSIRYSLEVRTELEDLEAEYTWYLNSGYCFPSCI